MTVVSFRAMDMAVVAAGSKITLNIASCLFEIGAG